MKSQAKKICAEAERLGYACEGSNSRGFLIYTGPAGDKVLISPSVSEGQAREISKAMRKAAGTFQATKGRDANAVKERQQRRRELDATRLAAERRDLQTQRDVFLTAKATGSLLSLDRSALAAIEARLRELDEFEAEMTRTPASGHHQGRVSHRAGSR